MKVKIKRLNSEVKLPNYANPGDAGMDFFSAENVIINSGERKTVKTGISMAIPVGFVGLFWDKSGLVSKKGIKTMAGVIDSGYRGEICVVLYNLSDKDFKIEKNMRIAQMLFQPFKRANIEIVEKLSKTQRDENGFGSTGLK